MIFKIIFGSWGFLMILFILAVMKSCSDADDADEEFLNRLKEG